MKFQLCFQVTKRTPEKSKHVYDWFTATTQSMGKCQTIYSYEITRTTYFLLSSLFISVPPRNQHCQPTPTKLKQNESYNQVLIIKMIEH